MRGNRGITMISLIITILLLLILAGVIIYDFSTSSSSRDFMRMRSDLDLLRDRVLLHYNNHGSVPTRGTPLTQLEIPESQLDDNDDPNGYYELDIEILGNITLNFGMNHERAT